MSIDATFFFNGSLTLLVTRAPLPVLAVTVWGLGCRV